MAGGVRFSQWRKHEWEIWFLGFLLIRREKTSESSLVPHFHPMGSSTIPGEVFWVHTRRYKATAQGSVSCGGLSPLF